MKPPPAANGEKTDFGFADIPKHEKARRVESVFANVAGYYDTMNDVMSLGMHRLWKRMAISLLDIQPTMRVLDIAGGSGDLSLGIAAKMQAQQKKQPQQGQVILSDINPAMLARGMHRLPSTAAAVSCDGVLCDGEQLPFADRTFDRTINGFGLRNMTNRDRALAEAARVLKCGGQCAVLEFTPQAHFPHLHRFYLTRILPAMGQLIASDNESYRYLGESILRFPAPAAMRQLFAAAALSDIRCYQFAAGAVAFYIGRRAH